MNQLPAPNPGAMRWDDVRCALRCIEEVREVNSTIRANHLLSGALGMLEAKVGVALKIAPQPDRNWRLEVLASEGWMSDAEKSLFADDALNHRYQANPFLRRLAEVSDEPGATAVSREQLVSDRTWYSSDYVQGTYQQLGLDDLLISLSPLPEPNCWGAVAVLRPWQDRVRFGDRERAMLTLLTDGCRGVFELPAVPKLPARLKQVHELLLLGLSEKEVAVRMGLSVHTVHRHVNRLYQVMGVSSRAELLSRGLG